MPGTLLSVRDATAEPEDIYGKVKDFWLMAKALSGEHIPDSVKLTDAKVDALFRAKLSDVRPAGERVEQGQGNNADAAIRALILCEMQVQEQRFATRLLPYAE
jgi:hypothetical protein